MSIDTELLDALLVKASQLKELLSANPDLVPFLQLLKDTGKETLELPVRKDRLVGPVEVRKILKISTARMEQYCKSGVLTAYYTPPKSDRKFWLSEVMSIPTRRKKQ